MTTNKKLIDIVLESGTFQTERVTKKFEKRGGWKPSNPKHIASFIPGTILEIQTKVGAKVKSGEPLMLFGAMKMDNIITSNMDGTVSAINVKIGESVPKGCVMIELK